MPTLDVNGTALFYREQGPKDAPTLVLSHSLFFDHRMFDPLIERLGERYRIISYDHRDQGQSARTSLATVDMETLAEDAAALIELLDAAPCYFVGNSMGGFIALRLAARKPELLKGCIVLGSSAEQEHKLEQFAPLAEGLRDQGTAPFIDTLMYIMFGDTTLNDPARAEIREPWRQFMLDLRPDVARCAHGVIHRDGVLDELQHAGVPLLVLAGEEDHAYEVALSQHMAEAAPQSEMHVVQKAGHSVALESPDVVAQHIEAFVGTQGGAGAPAGVA